MPPPALWLSHFAACLPALPRTSPQLVQAAPPLYTRTPSQPTGPSPSPAHLAQASTIYTKCNNLINDSLRNLTKKEKIKKNYRESRKHSSFLILPSNTIWSARLVPHTLLASSSRVHVPLDVFPTFALAPFPPLTSCPSFLCEVGPQHFVLLLK